MLFAGSSTSTSTLLLKDPESPIQTIYTVQRLRSNGWCCPNDVMSANQSLPNPTICSYNPGTTPRILPPAVSILSLLHTSSIPHRHNHKDCCRWLQIIARGNWSPPRSRSAENANPVNPNAIGTPAPRRPGHRLPRRLQLHTSPPGTRIHLATTPPCIGLQAASTRGRNAASSSNRIDQHIPAAADIGPPPAGLHRQGATSSIPSTLTSAVTSRIPWGSCVSPLCLSSKIEFLGLSSLCMWFQLTFSTTKVLEAGDDAVTVVADP